MSSDYFVAKPLPKDIQSRDLRLLNMETGSTNEFGTFYRGLWKMSHLKKVAVTIMFVEVRYVFLSGRASTTMFKDVARFPQWLLHHESIAA